MVVFLFRCSFVFFLLSACLAENMTLVNVTTPLGDVVGVEETRSYPDGSVYTVRIFKGIPYALPPLGQMRFAKPRPNHPFSEPFMALQFGPACVQRQAMGNMSEDCLYLNIYTPAVVQELSPVVVWIHGGAFMSGEGRQLPAERLASFGNVVAVTINFRLGALGFLSTDDEEAPGNWGLWDQRLALQWVKDNIVSFHGDPSRVTLAGTTSGANCVTFHSLYPGSAGLFHRVIAESDNGISRVSRHLKGRHYAMALAQELGCQYSASDPHLSRSIVACLRNKTPDSIAAANVRAAHPFSLVWVPVVDGDFIVKDPLETVSWPPSNGIPGNFQSVDALIGTTTSDGNIFINIWVSAIASSVNETLTSGVSANLFEKTVDAFVGAEYEEGDESWLVRQTVLQHYRNWEHPDSSVASGRQLVNLMTDKGFFIPSTLLLRNHASATSTANSSTYMYEFAQRSPAASTWPWLQGSLHRDQDVYVMGLPESMVSSSILVPGSERAEVEWAFSQQVMTYWSNFVKTGNPNSPHPVVVEWPGFVLDTEDYLHLQANNTAARRHCRAQETSLWLNFTPQLLAFVQNRTRTCSREDCASSFGVPRRVSGAFTCLGWVLFLMLFV